MPERQESQNNGESRTDWNDCWADDIQIWDCIVAWSVILSVHGADIIAEVKLLISTFCSDLLIYEINYLVFKQF